MRADAQSTVEAFDRTEWNALAGHFPFLRHEFLTALERTHCVGPETGWYPAPVGLRDARGLTAVAPCYFKTHSYGEFVFDFAWANAYTRSGLEYYPKMVVSAPFTPATGPRLLLRPDVQSPELRRDLISAVEAQAHASHASSIHALFIDAADREAFEASEWLLRRDCQFHWENRGYATFDDFLQTFTHDKRKKAKRERRRVLEAGITFETWPGGELDGARLDRVYALHRDTFMRHGHEPYLTRAFFDDIRRTMGDAWHVTAAQYGGETVACAIFFKSNDTLYGRYWGAAAEFNGLHFETCYHQGIEFCIANGLRRFEPGTQGEHKVSRGFEPRLTWSAHHIANSRFRAAIAEYLGREGAAIDTYASEIELHVPYKQTGRAD